MWLRVGDGEAAARLLFQHAGIQVMPGAYLARPDSKGMNPGRHYIRVALVHDMEVTKWALKRLRNVLAKNAGLTGVTPETFEQGQCFSGV